MPPLPIVERSCGEAAKTAPIPSLVVITTGVVGSRWRGQIAPSGAIQPSDGTPALRWLIAADDRWHDPEHEVTSRQTRRLGTPVTDTRVRVPGGDVEQTVWTVADHGGLTLVELRNASPLPVVIALTRRDVLTARAPSSAAVLGIEAPEDALVLPLGHRSSITVALAHDGRGGGTLPRHLPTADTVAAAWVGRADSASRLELPDAALVDRVRAVRVELMLAGIDGALQRDAIGALLALGELLRVGELTPGVLDDIVPDIAGRAEQALRRGGAGVRPAVRAAARLLAAAGERRAVADLRRGAARRDVDLLGAPKAAEGPTAPPSFAHIGDGDPRLVAAVEDAICDDGAVFAGGVPAGWAGQNLEAHGLTLGDRARLSLAVRWHGPNPALLWEIDPGGAGADRGDTDVWLSSSLTTPDWSTAEQRGEALLVVAA